MDIEEIYFNNIISQIKAVMRKNSAFRTTDISTGFASDTHHGFSKSSTV